MNTSLLKKNISNIVLSKSNSDINFFTTKRSFLDKNFSCLNDVFLEINKISEQEYGIKIKKNCLIFFRLEKPILFNNNKAIDLIFTLLTPNNFKTSHKLQILAKLTRILKGPNIRKEIKGIKKPEDVLALLLFTSS